MLSREKAKKMAYLSQPRERRELDELQLTSRDIASMIDREPLERALEYLNGKLNLRKIREIFTTKEGGRLEKHRKRQIPYDQLNELPAL